jgi:hypothetical protein
VSAAASSERDVSDGHHSEQQRFKQGDAILEDIDVHELTLAYHIIAGSALQLMLQI